MRRSLQGSTPETRRVAFDAPSQRGSIAPARVVIRATVGAPSLSWHLVPIADARSRVKEALCWRGAMADKLRNRSNYLEKRHCGKEHLGHRVPQGYPNRYGIVRRERSGIPGCWSGCRELAP